MLALLQVRDAPPRDDEVRLRDGRPGVGANVGNPGGRATVIGVAPVNRPIPGAGAGAGVCATDGGGISGGGPGPGGPGV